MKNIIRFFGVFVLIFSFSIIPAFAQVPLDRVDLSNPKLVNAFGLPITDLVNVNQQIQISADIQNNQAKSQPFIYIVQIKDQNEKVVSLGWISGSLSPGQILNPALSWTSKDSGTFVAEIFVWEGLVNHDALTTPTELTIIAS